MKKKTHVFLLIVSCFSPLLAGLNPTPQPKNGNKRLQPIKTLVTFQLSKNTGIYVCSTHRIDLLLTFLVKGFPPGP